MAAISPRHPQARFWPVSDWLINAVLQGTTFGVAVLGISIAFRILRYPDLTADGSFMTGATLFAALAAANWSWPTALALATLSGLAAGMATALLNAWLGITRLLSGILVAMICYSLAFHYLDGHSNVGLLGVQTMFAPAGGPLAILPMAAIGLGFAIAAMVLVAILLASEFGLVLRATGDNAELVSDFGHRPWRYRVAGLAVANALVALSGALVAAQQGFADVNMGAGTIITLVASLVIGEGLMRLIPDRPGRLARIVAPVLGATLYFALYIGVLRASLSDMLPLRIAPTDLKMLSALVVILIVLLQRRGNRNEEVLPL